jgi:hypothetical protein
MKIVREVIGFRGRVLLAIDDSALTAAPVASVLAFLVLEAYRARCAPKG